MPVFRFFLYTTSFFEEKMVFYIPPTTPYKNISTSMEGAHVLTRKPIDVTMLPKIVTFLQPNLLASALTTGPTKSNQIFHHHNQEQLSQLLGAFRQSERPTREPTEVAIAKSRSNGTKGFQKTKMMTYRPVNSTPRAENPPAHFWTHRLYNSQ